MDQTTKQVESIQTQSPEHAPLAVSKASYKAEEIAFKYSFPSNETLSEIKNSTILQKSTLLNCLKTIRSCSEFLEKWSKISYSETNFISFKTGFWEYIKELEQETIDCQDSDKEKLQALFRGEIHPYLTESKIASRALTKPLGYPGDFRMLQYLYNGVPCSTTNIGCFFDMFFIKDPLAQAVINRVNTMSGYLQHFIETSAKTELHILDIASGSGFDLIPIAKKEHQKKVYIHCFDQELSSLYYVKNKLSEINKNTHFVF